MEESDRVGVRSAFERGRRRRRGRDEGGRAQARKGRDDDDHDAPLDVRVALIAVRFEASAPYWIHERSDANASGRSCEGRGDAADRAEADVAEERCTRVIARDQLVV